MIEESLRAALRKLSSDGSTQEDLITIRGERFVIPVRSELKRRVSGVIHGASSSGLTVYVEPLETIEQNNELVRLLEDEQAEIHRIFVALTRQVGTIAHALVAGARVLALVDSLLARARFARAYDCVAPAITSDRLSLEAARHPLLEKRLRATGGKVVPLTLELTAQHRQLIISGPNTGGKTVTLKTTALLAMMAQAGIPVPATAASFPIFMRSSRTLATRNPSSGAFNLLGAYYESRSVVAAGGFACTGPAGRAGVGDRSRRGLRAGGCRGRLLPERRSVVSDLHAPYLAKVYAANTPGVLNAAAGVDEVTHGAQLSAAAGCAGRVGGHCYGGAAGLECRA